MNTVRQVCEANVSEGVLHRCYDIIGRADAYGGNRLESAAVDCRVILGQWQNGEPGHQLRQRMHGIVRLLDGGSKLTS